MRSDRRTFLAGGAALAANALLSPERAFARAANSAGWTLGVADVEADVAPRPMRLVRGRPPADFSGVLYRNGPAKFRRPGGAATHWFDGDGLIRRFAIQEGRATLSARFADTPKRRAEAAAEAMIVPGFGTRGSAATQIATTDDANAANTSVMAPDGRLWALWEGGSALDMHPVSLASAGFVTLRADLRAMPFSAHPRYEPDGRVWNFGLGGGRAVIWRLSRRGELESADVVDLPGPRYFHDFTATERSLVIVLQPWVRERSALPLIEGYAWRPDEGTQVLVIDKADPARRRVFELPTFSLFHLSDAWEERDGTIRFEVCAYGDLAFAAEGARRILEGIDDGSSRARLARIALHPDGRAVYEPLPLFAEFPRNDPRFAGLPRRLTFHVTGIESRPTPLPQGVAATDVVTGRSDVYDFGAGHLVEEAIFVPRPGSSAEGDGWLVGTSINVAARATELHLFDALAVARGPLATWRADIALPFTFHGVFVGG